MGKPHREMFPEFDLSLLKPFERNAKEHTKAQVNAIAASIESFDWTQPFVVDEDNVILCGHGRLMAAKKLGVTHALVWRMSGMNEAEKQALRIADNSINAMTGFMDEYLNSALAEIKEAGFDYESLGFDMFDFFKAHMDPDAVKEDEFDVPDINTVETSIVLGDLIDLGPHRLICGDATSADHHKALLGTVAVDLLFTDPPYNVAYVGKTKDALTIQNDKMSDDQFRQFLLDVFGLVAAALRPGASFYVCHADSEGLNFRGAVKDSGLDLKQNIIWVKDSMVMGRQDYHWKHEPILYGWKPGAAHYFIDDRTQTTVWEVERPRRKAEHPTMKPLKLIGIALQNSSKQNQVVFDPFLGSGSTLIACDQVNRICYGMEIDPRYCQVIVNRYREHCDQTGKPWECRINGKPA